MRFNLKKSVKEVYYTCFVMLLVKIMLCSKLYYQKVWRLKRISYKICAPRARPLAKEVPFVNPDLAKPRVQLEVVSQQSLFQSSLDAVYV